MTESSITHSAGGTMFAGPDAVKVFQAATLASGIGLLQKGIKPRRDWSMKKALAMATVYTGVVYKNKDAEKARADLKVWIETMKSAIPTIQE